jgi:glycosyltransferase involved in cell wall biosynthesis
LIIKKVFPNMPIVFHAHSFEEELILAQNLERRIAEVADMIITVSQSMKDYLVALGYPLEKIYVVWSGCNPEWYDPSKVDKNRIDALKKSYGIQQDDSVVLYLGQLTWEKGVDRLIHSIPSVLADFPNTKLLVIGIGELYHELVSLVSRMNLTEKIIVRNEWLSADEKIQHYGLVDVCVFPSFSEPFGNAALEAMAMKVPVVANDHGLSGFREQIVVEGSDQCGLCVNGKNPLHIAKGIKEVLKDTERAEKWGKNGRKRVLEHFTWEQTARATLDLYSKVTQKEGGTAS